MKKRILLVDDDKSIRETVGVVLKKGGYLVDTASTGEEMLKLFREKIHDLILLDLKLPDAEGMDLFVQIKDEGFNPIVIVITGHGTISSAVEAMRAGVHNYIEKPIDFDILEITIKEAFQKRELIEENIALKSQVSSKFAFQNIIGKSKEIQNVFELIKQASQSVSNVLILGETGTGKELVADAIHYNSPRKERSWVKINCAALNENLLESELFGHEKGAFTDAKALKKGRFEIAHKGDILLDEIGCMSLPIQAKILRVIENKEVMRLGGESPFKVDVRIVSSTNKDLETALKNKSFREDLFYRINVISIKVPPLRKRKEDIPLLIDFFIRKYNSLTGKRVETISSSALDFIMEHEWPGNIRQLENAIERAFSSDLKDKIFPKHLPKELVETKPYNFQASTEDKTLEQVEIELILQTLERTGGNKTETAKILGTTREKIRRALRKTGHEE